MNVFQINRMDVYQSACLKKCLIFLVFWHVYETATSQTHFVFRVDKTVKIELDSSIFLSSYNLNKSTRKNRWQMISTHENPFVDSNNNYARFLCVNRFTFDTIFNRPSIPIQKLIYDSTSNLLIGISYIYSWNPYQIVLFNRKGDIVFKQSINYTESKLNKKELLFLKQKHRAFFDTLKLKNRIYFDKNSYYINCSNLNMDKDSSLMDFFDKHRVNNHFCPSMSLNSDGTISRCLDENNPFIKIEFKGKDLYQLVLMDYKGDKIYIEIEREEL